MMLSDEVQSVFGSVSTYMRKSGGNILFFFFKNGPLLSFYVTQLLERRGFCVGCEWGEVIVCVFLASGSPCDRG